MMRETLYCCDSPYISTSTFCSLAAIVGSMCDGIMEKHLKETSVKNETYNSWQNVPHIVTLWLTIWQTSVWSSVSSLACLDYNQWWGYIKSLVYGLDIIIYADMNNSWMLMTGQSPILADKLGISSMFWNWIILQLLCTT